MRVLGLGRGETMQALLYAVIALFLLGWMVSARYRRQFRWAAIGVYAAAMALALLWVGVWLWDR